MNLQHACAAGAVALTASLAASPLLSSSRGAAPRAERGARAATPARALAPVVLAPPPAAEAARDLEDAGVDEALEACQHLAERDPPAFLRRAWALARDPGAAVALHVGVYAASQDLASDERTALWLELARAQGRARASGLEAIQREDLGRGLLDVLAERGGVGLLREELLRDDGVDRLWVAQALYAREALVGPRGLAPCEQARLAELVATELRGEPRDAARVGLLAALEPEARERALEQALTCAALAPEQRARLAALAAAPQR
ncbi:MAG: hypothetical protein R3F62_11925 [Planctomycetota bacterium]